MNADEFQSIVTAIYEAAQKLGMVECPGVHDETFVEAVANEFCEVCGQPRGAIGQVRHPLTVAVERALLVKHALFETMEKQV